jgi:hypothetical protein
MRDNVFYSNNGGAEYTCESTDGSGEYGTDNLSDDGSCNSPGGGSAVTDLDTTLQDNGGPTDTHALNSGSNAIGAASACTYVSSGTNNLYTDGTNITRDQRGALRPYNTTCDKGAVERQLPVEQCGLTTGVDIPVNGVTLNFSALGTLNCVTVERMYADHLMATGPGAGGGTLHTADWWHITGNGAGFTVSMTLPYTGANANSRVCKHPGGLGGYGWDCDDGTNTTYVASTSVTRSGITSFSDWAVGGGTAGVGPTAITLQKTAASPTTGRFVAIAAALGLGLGGLGLTRKRSRRRP